MTEQTGATEQTAAANRAAAASLPFGDLADFEDARRGLIAPLDNGGVITNDDGRVVWDLERFTRLVEGDAPETVHPSLWRQAQLLAIGGLFEVVPGVYQIRSADLSNMDVIEGDTGVIVVDPLISAETAHAALELYFAHRPRKPVVAVIYTHSHPDHFGGVRGVINEDDVRAGRVEVIAPEGFMDATVDEMVLAGNAMTRRATYMYGDRLEVSPTAMVANGLGLANSSGRVTLIAPTTEITQPIETRIIDGVTFTFLLAPDTEAPSEMLFYLPAHKALCAAEDATHTLHNLYTLRGAKTRDARSWVHYLDETIRTFSDADVVFAQHHWPIWGNERVIAFLEVQRDAYKFLHDQTLRLANMGWTMAEISAHLDWPDDLGQHFSIRGYYGSVNHNARAVYNFYLGYFDGNPAHLDPYGPVEAGARYVALAGGADKLLDAAQAAFDAGDYRWTAELCSHLVFSDPANQQARELQARAFEQLAFASENGVWRNFYLTGALELRQGPPVSTGKGRSAGDLARALPVGRLFDYLAVRLNPERAAGKRLRVNFAFTDAVPWTLELRHSVLLARKDHHFDDAAVTLSCSQGAFTAALRGETNLLDDIAAGTVVIDGELTALFELLGMLDQFDPDFAIVEP